MQEEADSTLNQLSYSLAHVKWFTTVWPAAPEPIGEVVTTPFLLGFGLTLAVMLVLTRYNVPLQELAFVKRIHSGLDRVRPYAYWVIRIGMAVPLVASGLSNYLFHYELGPVPLWLRIAQVLVGTALLVPRLDRGGAVGVFGLFGAGAALFGLHPMLDYITWLGAAFFLAARSTRAEAAGLPALYVTTGLSLSWVAVEKWVYPTMALDILAHHPIPTFGFPPDLFLMLAGWVELGVGYLLITGVLNRFLSLILTLIFVATSSLFGLAEVLGHWQLHAALIIFLTLGTGRLVTPVLWHRAMPLQLAFVGVTLIPFVVGLIGLYYLL
jgi:hypothetical protein